MKEQFDWVQVEPTAEDCEKIEREALKQADGMIVMGLDSHAMYERVQVEGSELQRWCLSSRLVMKDGEGAPVAFNFTAKVPYAEMSVEEAKERWTTILSTYLVSEWIPKFFNSDVSEWDVSDEI